MARKGDYKPAKRVIGNPNDPDGMFAWVERFLMHLRHKGQTERTVQGRRLSLHAFLEWAEQRSITSPREVTRHSLEAYQRHLYHRRTAQGRPLSFGAQRTRLEPLKLFFRWMTRGNALLHNPASELEMPKIPFRLPKDILSVAEVEDILRGPDLTEPLGLRDRAIMEVLWSTGMRRMELANLKLFDVDAERGTVMIRQGKGSKDRMIPIGARAAYWIDRYARTVRSKLVLDPSEPFLFLSRHGEPLDITYVSRIVRNHVEKSGVTKKGSCHMFRHSAATQMLENGADIRMIQVLLGHASLDSTAVYTLVSIRRLIEVHAQTHPGAMLETRTSEADGSSGDPPRVPVRDDLLDEVLPATPAALEEALQREAAEDVEDDVPHGDDSGVEA